MWLSSQSYCKDSLKDLQSSLPSWVDSDRASAVASFKVIISLYIMIESHFIVHSGSTFRCVCYLLAHSVEILCTI